MNKNQFIITLLLIFFLHNHIFIIFFTKEINFKSNEICIESIDGLKIF